MRTTSIDSVSGGSLVQRVARNGRTVSLTTLDAAVPSSWMTLNGDTARLNAAVVMTPGALLSVDGVKTLQLAGGNDVNRAAFLYTGSGRIQLRGVTVTSIDTGSGQAVSPDTPGRPYITAPISAGPTPPTARSVIWGPGRAMKIRARLRSLSVVVARVR